MTADVAQLLSKYLELMKTHRVYEAGTRRTQINTLLVLKNLRIQSAENLLPLLH